MLKLIGTLFFSILFIYNVDAQVDIDARSYIIMDYKSKVVLETKLSQEVIYPASITKLMALYIVFDALDNNKIKLEDLVVVSKNAFTKGNYKTGGSTLFLKYNESISIEKLILGIVVASGNDASIALAEHIGGTEEQFVELMNRYAKKLNLTNTNFANVDGIHDKNHYSNTQDLLILSYCIIKNFPQYYHYFSYLDIEHSGIKQFNRNRLLYNKIGENIKIDGLKTGHTDISKYSLSFSATDDNFRVVGVLSGAKNDKERYLQTKKLIEYVYENYHNIILLKKGALVKSIPIINGSDFYYNMKLDEDISIVLPKQYAINDIRIKIMHYKYMFAPIIKNTAIAKITLETTDGNYSVDYPVYATYDIPSSAKLWALVKAPFVVIRILLNTYL